MGGKRDGRGRSNVITGGDKSTNFGAPEHLFVANVRQGIEGNTIVDYLKRKGLEAISIEKISHKEARNASFKLEIKAEDKDKVLTGDIWPYGVRVRVYRHQRFKKDDQDDRRNQFTD